MRKYLLLIALCTAACGKGTGSTVSAATPRLDIGAATLSPTEATSAEKRSVILLVGDGMGPALLEWARLSRGPRAVDGMADSALVLTSSESDIVTDSAAAATAMATGKKTNNRSLGVDASGKPLPTVAEMAKKDGKRVGLVTTSFVWDATPGAFYAHTTDRDNLDLVTAQALEAKFDVLLGGGAAALDPAHRKDGKDMRKAFADAGYHIVDTVTAPGLPLLGLYAPEAMFDENAPSYAPRVPLADLAKLALTALSDSPKGFFLMLEDEGIDEMAHANALEPLGAALTAWDQTVRVALDYRKAHPETVVIALSDHDTGGFDLTAPTDCAGRTPVTAGGKSLCVGFSTKSHTALPITVFASGIDVPGAVIENTRVFDLVRQGLGLP